MVENNELRSKILNALEEWTRIDDDAVREDAFIDVDLIEGTVDFIDADDLIKYDLTNPDERLSYFTINPWDLVDYDESSESFIFLQDEVEDAIKSAISLQSEFQED